MPRGHGIAKARVAGTITRLSHSGLRFDQQVEELDAVSRDPVVLGEELGDRLADPWPTQATAAAIALLRASGADENVARRRVEWQQERARHRARGLSMR